MAEWTVQAVGRVSSGLVDLHDAPRQGGEGAPDAWIVLEPGVRAAADGIVPGDRLMVLTWLHAADRATLRTRPRDDPAQPMTGVFRTRSPHRPNPIGLHPVTVLAVEPDRLQVAPLEAVDGTPVLDLKVALSPAE
jgi:tRNA-Thr(GGU) m(6)t(6)A37 methyltransferase TsaA